MSFHVITSRFSSAARAWTRLDLPVPGPPARMRRALFLPLPPPSSRRKDRAASTFLGATQSSHDVSGRWLSVHIEVSAVDSAADEVGFSARLRGPFVFVFVFPFASSPSGGLLLFGFFLPATLKPTCSRSGRMPFALCLPSAFPTADDFVPFLVVWSFPPLPLSPDLLPPPSPLPVGDALPPFWPAPLVDSLRAPHTSQFESVPGFNKVHLRQDQPPPPPPSLSPPSPSSSAVRSTHPPGVGVRSCC